MRIVLAGGGWVAAVCAGLLALAAWRARAAAAEAVARACHELRGPLTASRLGLQLGMRSMTVSSSMLRAIDLELARAALALDDLSRCRGRAAALDEERWAWVDVGVLLADCVEAARGRATAAGATLRLQVPEAVAPPVWGERLRLAQALGNLITNAIEHGGGLVEVRAREEESALRIEVTDSGSGLAAPVTELMRGAHGGRGARGRGLAIATAIADAHGGRLGAAPSERGARLVLELPCAPAGRLRTG